MFGIGMPELLVILGLALIILGPKKLPDIARGLGRAMREFKRASDEMRDSLQEETRDLEEVKDTIVEEMAQATEPGDVGEEAVEPEEEMGATEEDTELRETVKETGKTDEVDQADAGEESTEKEEPAPG